MDGLRAQALQTFLSEQKFKNNADLQKICIPLVTVAKFGAHTTVDQTDVEWLQSTGLCNKINAPVENTKKEKATAVMRLVKFDRDMDGKLRIDQQTFMQVFDDFGFDLYWLQLILCSTYGFFPKWSQGGALYTCYLHTVMYTALWSYDFRTTVTKVLIIPRELSSNPERVFNGFLNTMKYQKDLVDDWRFCSFLSGVQLVRWIEGTAGENLIRIRNVEITTGHGAWRLNDSGPSPTTTTLVREAKELGFVLTALANVVRHASIARTVLNDLTSPQPPSLHQLPSQQSPTALNNIADAIALLEDQIQSGELQAGYLQERGRTQQSVIFNLLARDDARTSKDIAQQAQKDSYSMKTIAIMTMMFLPPTFFATLFSLPLLKWDSPKVMHRNFGIYWAFTLPTTLLVLLVWHWTSEDETIFAKIRARIKAKGRRKGNQELDFEKDQLPSTAFYWNGPRYRSNT
ncbi:hypothetical protein BDW02DRAFT_226889 [Decorospora gaudefroyi]|uniref:Uncharacterized protein n=1 Tax=Decorospora gaudefroyi TaxID=184978 RepID=A0A6A5JWV0_9PLEO|nr:hypothetical protein BDW02DRAFT_226889 [Decorospora gaudefroyi]